MGYCSFLELCILVFQAGWAVFYCVFNIGIYALPVYGFMHKQPNLLESNVVPVQLAQYLLLQLRRYHYSFAFTATPSIMANSSLMGQSFFIYCPTSSLLCIQPCMIYALRSFRGASWAVASFMCCMDVLTVRSIVVVIVLTFMLRPHISILVLFMLLAG